MFHCAGQLSVESVLLDAGLGFEFLKMFYSE